MVLRPTAKLLSKLGVPDATPPASTTMLGDWYVSVLQMRQGHFALAIAGATLLPVVIPARELRTLPQRLAAAVGAVLTSFGVPGPAIEREVAEMTEARYARTDNRSTVGVLMNLEQQLRFMLEDGATFDIVGLSRWLAETPITARDTIPDLATCKLFGAPKPRWARP
ncbi:MAG: hypothetical protein IPQ07_09130 [Myxococcales bacterium]|nr:hypothetical protein [Myxococcales bacterium]